MAASESGPGPTGSGKKKRASWVRQLERLGWKLALKHDLMGARVVKGENRKVSKLYDLVAPVYDAFFRRLEGFQTGGPRLVEAVVRPGDRVLDMGTGTGINLEHVYRRTESVHGVDLHVKMLDQARKWARKNRRTPALVQASATELPYASETFDAILTAYMMVYLNPEQSLACLAECRRLLVPGGRLGILCGQGEKSPRNPRREEWVEQLYRAGFTRVEFDDFYDVLRVVKAEKPA